jgi:hypothetical protein
MTEYSTQYQDTILQSELMQEVQERAFSSQKIRPEKLEDLSGQVESQLRNAHARLFGRHVVFIDKQRQKIEVDKHTSNSLMIDCFDDIVPTIENALIDGLKYENDILFYTGYQDGSTFSDLFEFEAPVKTSTVEFYHDTYIARERMIEADLANIICQKTKLQAAELYASLENISDVENNLDFTLLHKQIQEIDPTKLSHSARSSLEIEVRDIIAPEHTFVQISSQYVESLYRERWEKEQFTARRSVRIFGKVSAVCFEVILSKNQRPSFLPYMYIEEAMRDEDEQQIVSTQQFARIPLVNIKRIEYF